MGGHESKQSVHVTTDVVGAAVQSTTQRCVGYETADNSVYVIGDNNTISGAYQDVTVTFRGTCEALAGKDGSFENKVASSIAQALSDQEVALTQWLDNSRDDQSAAIDSSVKTSITQKTVQTCLSDTVAGNTIYIAGAGNDLDQVLQTATADITMNCLLQDQDVASTVNRITNGVNQHSQYTSKNPFAFITDAIEAVMRSAIMAAVVMFIVIVCFVGIFMALHRPARRPAAPPAYY